MNAIETVGSGVVESMVNDEPRMFDESSFSVGDAAHQGDLIFVRIESLPESAVRRDNRQLAEGSTQGSRHILEFGLVFDCDRDSVSSEISKVCHGVSVDPQYIGPVIQTSDGVADITHPEHGDHLYRGDMVIACVYQRSLDAEQREQRVRD